MKNKISRMEKALKLIGKIHADPNLMKKARDYVDHLGSSA